MTGEYSPCRACGELVPDECWREITQGYCAECHAELTTGEIPDVTGPVHEAHATHLTPRQREKLGSKDGG
jgi:hypothetical protein